MRGHSFSAVSIHSTSPAKLQPKLAINQPGDVHEQEADRVAGQVMRMPNPIGPPTQRVASGAASSPSSCAPPLVHDVLRSPGQPIDAATRGFFEPRFGRSFSDVRVHTDSAAAASAQAVNAQAYTVGRNVVFNSDRYAPGSTAGRRLIAHELTHVVQQEGAPAAIQRTPGDASSKPASAGSFPGLDTLQVAEGVLDLSLDVIAGVPLTPEEMYELLLIRRAEPLSLPASVVNEAPQRLAELDEKIAGLDRRIQELNTEVAQLQAKQKSEKGFVRDMTGRQIKKLGEEARGIGPQRKKLLADKIRLKRGQALGTPGRGAAAGTGQITYAGIQVVDSSGKRVAVEFAETSATEHAEERIIARLRAQLTPEQLKGARLTVVGDQKVCGARCRRALVSFAQEFGVESVQAKVFVRPRIGQPGEASPRTTLRTATQPSSAGLPVRELTEEIYRRPASPSPGGAKPPPAAAVPADAPAGTLKTVPKPSATEAEGSPARPTTPSGEASPPRFRTRFRAQAMELGFNIATDLILDLVMAKFYQWRNDRLLRERLEALTPTLIIMKNQALQRFLSDPWATGTTGFYFNILVRITSTTTTAIGGGRAFVIPGTPRPQIVNVSISSSNQNRLVDESEAVRLFHVSEGATGGVYQNSETQLVVYSEPLSP